jgi:hypothetical protein
MTGTGLRVEAQAEHGGPSAAARHGSRINGTMPRQADAIRRCADRWKLPPRSRARCGRPHRARQPRHRETSDHSMIDSWASVTVVLPVPPVKPT